MLGQLGYRFGSPNSPFQQSATPPGLCIEDRRTIDGAYLCSLASTISSLTYLFLSTLPIAWQTPIAAWADRRGKEDVKAPRGSRAATAAPLAGRASAHAPTALADVAASEHTRLIARVVCMRDAGQNVDRSQARWTGAPFSSTAASSCRHGFPTHREKLTRWRIGLNEIVHALVVVAFEKLDRPLEGQLGNALADRVQFRASPRQRSAPP